MPGVQVENLLQAAQSAVKQEEVVECLRAEARRLRRVVGGTDWYLFGSWSGESECGHDVDVLVLCDSDHSVALVREGLRELCIRLPLHLFLITRDEEKELQFIESQGCVELVAGVA